MNKSRKEALTLAQEWLSLTAKPELTQDEAHAVITDAKENSWNQVNKGWLEYRKSVTEAGQWAATEWTSSGAVLRDVLGREYVDCLGAYGLLSLGWSHPGLWRQSEAS